ncbi:phosphodiesterase [bacterium]|nr:phosphodiesterase [bacterium]
MKLMIASDIHGSAVFCHHMLQRLDEECLDRLILLGDLLYHGPRNALPEGYDTKTVAEMLNSVSEKLLCVKGNCDSDVDQIMLNFPIMADYAVLFEKGHLMYFTHGHKIEENGLIFLTNKDFLIHGHTHIPAAEKTNKYTYINPGSVSIPKNNSSHSYIIFENDIFHWKDVVDKSIFMRYDIG